MDEKPKISKRPRMDETVTNAKKSNLRRLNNMAIVAKMSRVAKWAKMARVAKRAKMA